MIPTVAALVAAQAHEGQRYGDKPYIEHVQDVAWRVMRDPRTTPDAVVVAWLHDVIEDTDVTIMSLTTQEGGLNGPQIEALKAITRQPDEAYSRYLTRVCANPIAALVKLHDLHSNLANDPKPELRARYERAVPFVGDALLGVVYCRSKACRAAIVYLKTKAGKFMPVNRASLPAVFDRETLIFNTELGHESHYATCPDADRFRRRKP